MNWYYEDMNIEYLLTNELIFHSANLSHTCEADISLICFEPTRLIKHFIACLANFCLRLNPLLLKWKQVLLVNVVKFFQGAETQRICQVYYYKNTTKRVKVCCGIIFQNKLTIGQFLFICILLIALKRNILS
jgi:hypothetical protein